MAGSDLASRVAAVDGIRRSVMGIVLNAIMSGISGLIGVVLLIYYSPTAGAVALGLVLVAVAVIFAVLGFAFGPDAKVSTGGFMVFVSTFQSFLTAGVIAAPRNRC